MQRIASFEELLDVMSNLHDCPFDLDKAMVDEAAGRWIGRFLRPLWEDPGAEHKKVDLLFSRSRLPVALGSLCFEGVTNVQVVDDQGIGRYTLNEIERAPHGVRLCFNEAMRIDLHLAGDFGATYDEQPLPGVRAIYQQFLLLQTGPTIEEQVDSKFS